jgi:selenophosphate synthase
MLSSMRKQKRSKLQGRGDGGDCDDCDVEISSNVSAGFQQLMRGQQQAMQGMAALLVRIQGTDASVAMIGNAVSNIPGTEFVMPAPTAAAVTGYGGGGGTIAAAAEAGASESGAPNDVT